eukprot:CAMPEP_0203882310 /NCGR_PEP_ID=MMETSP0359-20131031/26551_1 /ASSEMBLY_ACC=CAM_ASM_000338 /TAXON_ID=268821 /ORGANISM="Scrippsiella Hangoei, Strain SHTV-5" /LENGTH=73 /DNA_ID=CAMNT_0050802339 /DNA_START=73 /DNA_END=290 /DNA_ORIENTATION=-
MAVLRRSIVETSELAVQRHDHVPMADLSPSPPHSHSAVPPPHQLPIAPQSRPGCLRPSSTAHCRDDGRTGQIR